MKIEQRGETLDIKGIRALNAANSQAFKTMLCGAVPERVKNINLDFSETSHVDCRGLGALVALRNCAARTNGKIAIRVLNPSPPVRHIFQLTQMDRVFPLDQR